MRSTLWAVPANCTCPPLKLWKLLLGDPFSPDWRQVTAMLDFEIQRCTRRCAKMDREFQPGEAYFSVLLPDGTEVVREDYCEQAWEGPPEDAVGWWKAHMAEATAKKQTWAPHDVMLYLFEQWENQPDKRDVRYILTLLMVRRRIVRLEDAEYDTSGQELLVVFCPRNDTEYRVPVVTPTTQRSREIQDELGELLFSDAA